jgi:hypothetical protein
MSRYLPPSLVLQMQLHPLPLARTEILHCTTYFPPPQIKTSPYHKPCFQRGMPQHLLYLLIILHLLTLLRGHFNYRTAPKRTPLTPRLQAGEHMYRIVL